MINISCSDEEERVDFMIRDNNSFKNYLYLYTFIIL